MVPKKVSTACLILFATIFMCHGAGAVPVLQHEVILTQDDGSTFAATPYGDEWHNGYETKDGFTVLYNEGTGNWVYADRAPDGLLIRTGRVVNMNLPPASEHLRPLLPEEPQEMPAPPYDAEEGPVRPGTGNQRALVILVQFANRTLMTTEAQWADLVFNAAAFSKVRHYYKESSYSNMDLIPASESFGTANNGVVRVTLAYNHPNTAGDTGTANRQLTRDALIACDPFVNFAAFDTNGNGYLSTDELHVVIIVAGYETAYGGTGSACSPSVWAHTWALFGTEPPTLDGKIVAADAGYGAYTQQGEWHCATWDNPGHMATIGVIVHELGHSLWLPDEYDTDGSSEGIGNWGLMGSGSWNYSAGGYSGNCPSHPTAWDKWYLGWLVPVQITGTQSVNIPDITTNPTVYQLRDNPNGVDWSFDITSGIGEYFLVENREFTGYNAGLPGSGLLVWHIWEGASQWNDANQNEAGRRLIDLREADGLNHLDWAINQGNAGDPFPGTSNNTVFNDTSNPSSKLYCSSGVGFCDSSTVSITNISAPGPTMSAILSVGSTPTPDLIVSSLTAPAACAGTAINITDTTKNNGQDGASPSTTGFYLSTNSTWDAGDVLLGSRAVPALSGGGTSTGTTLVTIPSGTLPRTYYLIAKADAPNAIAETDEGNNKKYKKITINP